MEATPAAVVVPTPRRRRAGDYRPRLALDQFTHDWTADAW